MHKQVRICIKTKDAVHKATTIFLMSDGSFSVDIPYCPYDTAIAMKFQVDYSKSEFLISLEDTPEKKNAGNRPKMTMHSSGFVQLSGPGVTSGIDKQTKEARGLGVYSNPLTDPIYSGPTMGVEIWGLQKFELDQAVSAQDIVFEESDFIQKIIKTYPRDHRINTVLNTYSFEIFVFPKNLSTSIKVCDGIEKITLSFPQYRECSGAIFTMPVIRLRNHDSFLGILAFVTHSEFPENHEFGFTMGSPSGTNLPDGKGTRFNIQVIYPNIAPELTTHSLDHTNFTTL